MEKLNLLYKAKAKEFYATKDPNILVVHYTDDATAFNGIKKATLADKAIVNNKFTTMIYNILKPEGIPMAYIDTINETDQLYKKVDYIPLEIICRNVIAGSCSTKLGIEEGTKPTNAIYELCYKNDELKDPMINEHHAVAIGLATYEEIDIILNLTKKINEILAPKFTRAGLTLVDFKIEFGRTADGKIILADEISPDTARVWDSETKKKLDKDRFRRDLGNVIDGYREIASRLSEVINHE